MDLEELIRSIDIVEYISQFIDLEQRGSEWWGLSCFKSERTPSFSIRKDPAFFYDYSSGLGGNVFTFVKHYFNCSNKEAVEKLKSFAGYEGHLTGGFNKMRTIMDCKRFAKPKISRKEKSGVVLPDDYMDRYEYRTDKLAVWENEGISRKSLTKFQVKYDAFSDRLVYPIRNIDGKIVNVGGRTLDPCWKEKKLRKYTYFHSWGVLDIIYGLYENMDAIREQKEVVLFEGCKSVLLADTWGIKNTGAILTSHLNMEQVKVLAKLGCRVVFALDKDVNVLADKNITKLKRYVNCEFIFDRKGLLDEKDAPVDKGIEVFKTLYDDRFRVR